MEMTLDDSRNHFREVIRRAQGALVTLPKEDSHSPEASDGQLIDPEWPKLDHAALHGLAGEVVRLIEPHTEADPVALLVSFSLNPEPC